MRRRLGGAALPLACALTFGACSDGPTQPADLLRFGTYAAVAIDGAPLPYHSPAYDIGGDSCHDTIEAARLTLRPSGTYRLIQVMEIECPSAPDGPLVIMSHGDFARDGDTLTFLAVDELGTGTLGPDLVEFEPATPRPYYGTRFRFLSGDTVGGVF